MKTLKALICPLAALTFSAVAHAAPVQYQLTAAHTDEVSQSVPTPGGEYIPVSPDDYFFADGAQITATFYYDAAAPASFTSNTYSFYTAGSGLSIEIAGTSTPIGTGDLSTLISNSATPPIQDLIVFSSGIYPRTLAFGDFQLYQIRIGIPGPTEMLSSQSLPESLIGLNASTVDIILEFRNLSGNLQAAAFRNGSISQVPLPSSALFFLSGLIGLGANAARKLKR